MANDSLDFVQRGKVSIVKRQYADAVKICRLGLLAHPTLLEGRLVLGMALTALQRWDEVLAEMRVALETDGQSALAWLLKGEALVGKGDYQQAEATLLRAKELDPSNSKADQLLAEIHVARAAGFEGVPAEPTDTKVYPAKVSPDDAKLADAAAPLTGGSGTDLPEGMVDEPSVEYEDDATEVDPDPSDKVEVAEVLKPKPKNGGGPPQIITDSGSDTFDEPEDTSTETFMPSRVNSDSSYEPPAHDDYAERARPRAPSLSDEPPSEPGFGGKTPLHRPNVAGGRMPSLAGKDGKARAPITVEGTEPSIELSGSDLLAAEPEQFDLSDEEDEETAQRHQRQVDENAGTRPEAPEPVVRRAKPLRPFEPGPEARARPTYSTNDAPTGLTENPGPSPPPRRNEHTSGTPGVVRVPVTRPPSLYPAAAKKPLGVRLRHWLLGERGAGGLALFVTALVAVVALGVVTGLIVRELRMRGRVAKRHELARQKLAAGNYPGFQAAETLYRNILSERDDALARALRARTLAQMAFEFGDSPELAARAVAGLGDAANTPEGEEARAYLALAKGDLDMASRLAQSLRRKHPDASSSYLLGRAELSQEHPEAAADALRAAAEKAPRDPLVLHGLGLAEIAARREDRALEAYRRALDANANHIATIIDRALLQVRRAESPTQAVDRDTARGALEGVVQKLVGDASPGQLARAFLGLGELELARGDLDAGRKALASASAKRREGDASLSEELARASARAFDLDLAEKEAKRAMAGMGSSRLGPRLVLAEVALRRGRPAEALSELGEIGRRPDALVLRAQAELLLGRREDARRDAEEALHVLPELTAAKVVLARVDVADGHPERALRDLDRMERQSKSAEVEAALGEVYTPRAPDRARFWLTEALSRDPLLIEARLSLAHLLRDINKLDDARSQLNQILSQNPAYVPAQRDLASLALDLGDAEAAIKQYEPLAEREPDVQTLLGASRAHLALGDSKRAKERAEKANQLVTASGPLSEEVHCMLARVQLAQRRWDEVIKSLKPFANVATRGETGGLLMTAYLEQGQPDRAAGVPLTIPPRMRGAPEILIARGRLMLERGRDGVAEGLAFEALRRLARPTAPRWVKADAQTVLGRAMWNQGNFKPALKALLTATQLDPAHQRAFYYLGLVYEETRRMTESKEALQKAVQNDEAFDEAWYYLGSVRKATGDETWKDAWERYLQLKPDGMFAQDVRRVLGGGSPNGPAPRRKGR